MYMFDLKGNLCSYLKILHVSCVLSEDTSVSKYTVEKHKKHASVSQENDIF